MALAADIAPVPYSGLKFDLALLRGPGMKRTRFSEEQIIAIVKEHEAEVEGAVRRHGGVRGQTAAGP